MKSQRKFFHFDQLRFLKINKYSISILCFIVWISFFDHHSLINQYKLSKSIQLLNDEKTEYMQDYEIALKERQDLIDNKEKYAREHHNFMAKDEELFIIKDK